MYNVYKLNEMFSCPHCGVQQEYPISDYLVKLGGDSIPSKEDCHDCYKKMHFYSKTDGLVRLSRTKQGLLVES